MLPSVPRSASRPSGGSRFDLYVMDVSYFSGKLECYFRFKELGYRRIEPTLRELQQLGREHTGSTQVPLVYDAREDVWLRDTTPIIERFEADAELTTSANRVVPADPELAWIAWLIEDYADESLWRLGMFYRWAPRLDATVLSTRFAYEFARELPWRGVWLPAALRARVLRARQRLFSVAGEDIRRPEQFAAMEREYHALLDTLEPILARSPYLLGSRPSVADFGLMGPCFRHLSHDPTPRKIMQQRAPRVYGWCGRMFSDTASALPPTARFEDELSAPATALFQLAALQHARYGRFNAAAVAAGERAFRHPDGSTRPAVPYRAWSFAQLQRKLVATGPSARARLEARLRGCGAWRYLFSEDARAEDLASLERCIATVEPEGGIEPPRCAPGAAPLVGEKWPLASVLWRLLGGGFTRR